MSAEADELQDAIGRLRYVHHHIDKLELDADSRATLQIVFETSEELAKKVDALPVDRAVKR